MNKRTKWILFVAVIAALSVLWPLSYVLRHSPSKNPQLEEDNNTVTIIEAIESYKASVTGNVTSISPELLVVAYSDFGSRDAIAKQIRSLGVSGVNVSRSESDNENFIYRFDIMVNLTNSSDIGRVYYLITRLLNLSIASAFAPADVTLPDNATFSGESGDVVLNIPKNTLTFVYPGTRLGENQFTVYLEKSGPSIRRAIAIGGTPFFIPETETEYTPVTGNVVSEEFAVVKADVSGLDLTKINETELGDRWNATVSLDNTSNASYLIVKAEPSRLDELEKAVSSEFNVIDSYYLSKVKVDIDNSTYVVDNVITHGEKEVSFTAKVTRAYGYIVDVSYFSP